MRIAVLTAMLLLVAGCSAGPEQPPALTPITPKPPSSSTPATTTTISKPQAKPGVPSAAPSAATPIETIIGWVEAGAAADSAGYHSATRDGATTQLGDQVAFITPSGTTKCMTNKKADGALMCLVNLADPPAQPTDTYGQWIGGWVDYDGTTLGVGSSHADPGPFAAGSGAQLPYGSTLRFGDYQCRSDKAALYCVNFAHLSGVRFADSGVEPLGCLRLVSQPELGLKFSC